MIDQFAGDSRTNHERMLAGDWYVGDDPENERLARRAMRLMELYRSSFTTDGGASRIYLEELVGHLGEGAFVKPPLYVDYGGNLSVGDRTFVNYNLTALDVAPIAIGADCQIGPNVQLLTPIHPLDPRLRRDKLESALPVSIGDNVWLGAGAIVLPGVKIGENSVVGAGAVVTKDIPADVVVAGNPARILKKVEPSDVSQ